MPLVGCVQRQAIVQSFMEGCWVQAPWARNARVVVQDVLSPLLTILVTPHTSQLTGAWGERGPLRPM